MEVREIVGVVTALVILAGFSMAVVNGGGTAAVVGSLTNGLAHDINAATLRG